VTIISSQNSELNTVARYPTAFWTNLRPSFSIGCACKNSYYFFVIPFYQLNIIQRKNQQWKLNYFIIVFVCVNKEVVFIPYIHTVVVQKPAIHHTSKQRNKYRTCIRWKIPRNREARMFYRTAFPIAHSKHVAHAIIESLKTKNKWAYNSALNSMHDPLK